MIAIVISSVVSAVVCVGIYILVTRYITKKTIRAQREAALKEAVAEGEMIKKERILQAKEKFIQLKSDYDRQVNERNQRLAQSEQRAKQLEAGLQSQQRELESRLRETERQREQMEAQRPFTPQWIMDARREWHPELGSLYADPPNPLQRPRITDILDVGVRAINGLITLGKGQRVGIMAGSGVGKSTLMGMMARYTKADVNVIGLIGERGREVLEFMERDLGPEGMARSVLVIATSDQSPLVRMRAAYAATAVAEYFRDKGKDVLLMMDSVTRFAMAAREVGLAIGEPPTTKGYTPTVFAQLPKLLERAGRSSTGTITGVYTVLVDGDDFNEPIADAVRSILDGHIVLTRDLADQGHFPAIDVLRSISRLRSDICKRDDLMAGRAVLRSMSTYRKVEDMVNIGAYARGSNPEIDEAIIKMPLINNFLRQEVAEKQDVESSMGLLRAIVDAPGTLPPPQEAPAAQNKLQKVPPVPGGLRRG